MTKIYTNLRNYQEFVDHLAKWIGDKTLQERGKTLGVAASTLHYWLTERSTPSRRTILSVAPKIGVSTRSLMKVCKR